MPHLKGHNGFNWHYDIDGEGENLVFLHGWGVDKRIWRQQSKYFLKFYKVTTIDLPGHGQTNWQNCTAKFESLTTSGIIGVEDLSISKPTKFKPARI